MDIDFSVYKAIVIKRFPQPKIELSTKSEHVVSKLMLAGTLARGKKLEGPQIRQKAVNVEHVNHKKGMQQNSVVRLNAVLGHNTHISSIYQVFQIRATESSKREKHCTENFAKSLVTISYHM